MKKTTKNSIAGMVLIGIGIVIIFFCTAYATSFREQPNIRRPTAMEQAKKVVSRIQYIYDIKVDICYAVATSYGDDGTIWGIGITVVPYEKVKSYAIVINTAKPGE